MKRFVAAGLVFSLAVAVILSRYASSLPDGLESVAGRAGFLNRAHAVISLPVPDTGFGRAAGVLAVFVVVMLCGILLVRKTRAGTTGND